MTRSLFFTLSESVAKRLDTAGTLTDGVWKIETGRKEQNLKLQDQTRDVSQADKASIRSVGSKHTKKILKINNVTLY
jgi:hypothetical protein